VEHFGPLVDQLLHALAIDADEPLHGLGHGRAFQLGQLEKRVRPNEDHFQPVGQLPGPLPLFQQKLAVEGELPGQFRHQVVVVGVEPLGHLQRSDALVAPGQGVVERGRNLPALFFPQRLEPFRDAAQPQRGVQHLVVEGKVAHGQQFQVAVPLPLQLAGLQLPDPLLELLLGELAGPVAFQRAFVFPAGAQTRVARHGGRVRLHELQLLCLSFGGRRTAGGKRHPGDGDSPGGGASQWVLLHQKSPGK